MKKDIVLLKELSQEKKRNFKGNLDFVKLRAKWMVRSNDKNWNTQRKQILDSIYKRNRKLKIDIQ